MIPLHHYLVVGAALFALGAVGFLATGCCKTPAAPFVRFPPCGVSARPIQNPALPAQLGMRPSARFFSESGTSVYQKQQNQCGVWLPAECSVAALVY